MQNEYNAPITERKLANRNLPGVKVLIVNKYELAGFVKDGLVEYHVKEKCYVIKNDQTRVYLSEITPAVYKEYLLK